jgi:NADPH:quinone reductase-like Zn-dependent oxidoreductase
LYTADILHPVDYAHTAWRALFEKGLSTGSFEPTSAPHVSETGEAVLGQAKGERVLILGAGGGVGLMAVQFAKLASAHVAETARRTKATWKVHEELNQINKSFENGLLKTTSDSVW